MDEQQPPTAAELGLSDEEYARILRGLDGRLPPGSLPPPPAAPPGETDLEPPRSSVSRTTLLLALLLPAALVVALLVRSPSDDETPEYAFSMTMGGEPVAYTSCRPIQVAVYPAGGPPGAFELASAAVSRAASASGLQLVVIGPYGGAAPNWNFEAAPVQADDPISISWQDGDAIAELTDHVAGLGGSRYVDYPGGRRRLVAGTIALSRDYYRYLEEVGDRDQQLAVLLHELGHVLGLDHVDNPGELMHEENLGQTAYGPGDLAGLRRLGEGPCF